MKNFADYLTESKKTYEFKIGIAGEQPDGCEDMLETGLQKFGITKMSAGKKTPIQERPLDFPQLENCEVHYYEVELTYPTTVQVLQEYLGSVCSVPQSHIIVRNPNEPQELYQQEDSKEEYVSKLTVEELGGESAQEDAGGARVMNLLKELETARKERNNDYVGEAPVGDSKDIGDVENTKSPVGA
jgi:hypothetical protein